LVAGLAVEPNGDIGRAPIESGDTHAREHLDAALGERAYDGLRDLLVDTGENLRQHFEDRDLRAHVDEERCELAADGTASDDRDPRRNRVDLEHLVRGEHALTVEVETGNREGA